MALSNLLIANNVVRNVTNGINITGDATFENIDIINNSVYGGSNAVLVPVGALSNSKVVNNALDGNSSDGTGINIAALSSTPIDYNVVYGYSAGYGGTASAGGASFITDPLFVDSTNMKLQGGSPAIDSGAGSGTYTEVPLLDIRDTTRPQVIPGYSSVTNGTDIGAYEMLQGEIETSYSVNFYAGANGSLSGDTTQTVDSGNDASAVTAVPDTGYDFSAWSGDNTSTDNPLTVTNITTDMDMTANFTIQSFSVNFYAGADGSLTGDTAQTINYDGTATAVTAVPDTGFNFSAWSGSITSTDNPLTVAGVSSDMDMTANFASSGNYSVTFTAAGNKGSFQGDANQTVAGGSDASPVLAQPIDGYEFTNWTGAYDGTDNPLTLTDITGDTNAVAHFRKIFSKSGIFKAGRSRRFDLGDQNDTTGAFSPARFLGSRGVFPIDVSFPGE